MYDFRSAVADVELLTLFGSRAVTVQTASADDIVMMSSDLLAVPAVTVTVYVRLAS